MRTRKGYYPSLSDGITFSIRPKLQKLQKIRAAEPGQHSSTHKRVESSCFDALDDDLLISIMVAVSATATSPADLVNSMLVSKRFCAAGTHPRVLSGAGSSALAVKAAAWSVGAQRFLIQCTEAGNVEACYILGMIRFYCLFDLRGGAALLNRAAMSSHAAALYSLAVIRFNGSEGSRQDKDVTAGAQLCARAASLGHVDAMREFGHCLQDGYGVKKNVAEGRRLLLEANAREAAAAVAASPRVFVETALQLARNNVAAAGEIHAEAPRGNAPIQDRSSVFKFLQVGGHSLLSDFGCNVPPAQLHVVNKVLVDWFVLHPPPPGLRLCSHENCGRPELRRHEFRRCSACGSVNYCSRACQALDWKLQHKHKCTSIIDGQARQGNGAGDVNHLDMQDLYEY